MSDKEEQLQYKKSEDKRDLQLTTMEITHFRNMFMNWKTPNQVQLPLHYDGLCSFTCTQRGAVYNCAETSSSGVQLCVHTYKHTG